MTQPEVAIDPRTGAIAIEGTSTILQSGASRNAVASVLSAFLHANQDHGNGYEWLVFRGLFFGGEPAHLSACFHIGRLCEVTWNVNLRNNIADESWPSQEACDLELAFVRGALTRKLGRPFISGQERFPWGLIWSFYDPRAGFISSGLRYTG